MPTAPSPHGTKILKLSPFRWISRQSGFTLIELLVALVVLSVGLLGLAGLQGRGLQDNKSAILRSLAVQSAGDILDRMRANRPAALSGNYDVNLTTTPATPTSTATLSQVDLYQWKTGLTQALPSGNGSVAVSGNIATVEVRWREAGWATAADDQIVRMVTRL